MFKNVIVKRPCKAMTEGITSAPELGKPDYELALKQHGAYIEVDSVLGKGTTFRVSFPLPSQQAV